MTPERRNALVVFALIASMTVGVAALFLLEWGLVPKKPTFVGNPLLMAEYDRELAEVEVAYAGSPQEADALVSRGTIPDSFCVIDADGNPRPWEARGPRWRLVVIGSDADRLRDAQKKTLLDILGTISAASGQEPVPVRFTAGSEGGSSPDLPPQADDLRKFLVRKGFIR